MKVAHEFTSAQQNMEGSNLKAGRKILSLLLAVCMLICMLPTAVFAASNDDYMKVAMLDSGRKYFTVD